MLMETTRFPLRNCFSINEQPKARVESYQVKLIEQKKGPKEPADPSNRWDQVYYQCENPSWMCEFRDRSHVRLHSGSHRGGPRAGQKVLNLMLQLK
jgi:hypothetical protein